MSTADVRSDGTRGAESTESAPGTEGVEGVTAAEGTETAEAVDAAAAADDTAQDGAGDPDSSDDEGGAWDDGLIARRASSGRPPRSMAAALWETEPEPVVEHTPADSRAAAHEAQEPLRQRQFPEQAPAGGQTGDTRLRERHGSGSGTSDAESALGRRVVALRRLVDLSRTALPRPVLAEADRVLDAADARARLSRDYTTVAIAGATGSGKSSLFNTLAGTRLSQTGMRRPTTSVPLACSWEVPGAGPADGLLDRLGIQPSARRRMRPESDWTGRIDEAARSDLEGLILLDLPDHDSAAKGHREQVERLLRLVDAVVWVVDPEKYADAMLHERYLRPLAGHAEVTFVVLNQTDRLPGDATDAVLNDLRRLLDEDGMALGEYGEPGARVLATSAADGEGIEELRAELAQFVAERRAAALRLGADLDVVVERLRPQYELSAPVAAAPSGLTEEVREDFSGRLALAAGAAAAGRAAERAWLRHAERACGTPWAQLQHRVEERRSRKITEVPTADGTAAVADEGFEPDPAAMEPTASAAPGAGARPRVARPAVAHAVRTVVDQATQGLPDPWRRSVRDAARRGSAGLPEGLDEALRKGAGEPSDGAGGFAVPHRPYWWKLAMAGQLLLLIVQSAGGGCVLGAALGAPVLPEWAGVTLLLGGVLGGSLLSWGCRYAARGPAAEYGRQEEQRLRRLVAGCGQVHVLEHVASELLRYREVREQFVIAAGDSTD